MEIQKKSYYLELNFYYLYFWSLSSPYLLPPFLSLYNRSTGGKVRAKPKALKDVYNRHKIDYITFSVQEVLEPESLYTPRKMQVRVSNKD